MKKNERIICILLYLIAGMLLLYTMWAYMHCHSYIKEAILAGQIERKGSEYELWNFYMTNCGVYLVYAIVIFVLGRLLIKTPVSVNNENYTITANPQNEDSELDDWFKEMKQK